MAATHGHPSAPRSGEDASFESREAEALRSAVARGKQLDDRLARDLGRPRPRRVPVSASYLAALARPRPGLDEETERRLVAAAQAGDQRARAVLVDTYMPQMMAIARNYRDGYVDRQELLQEGVVGLLRALERYDPRRGVPFWGYASWWVRHAMQRLVSELTRPVVLSDRAMRRLARLKQAHFEIVQRTGREPTRQELAGHSGVELQHVDDILAAERAARSLDELIDAPDGEVGVLGDLVADPLAQDAYERVLESIEAEQLRSLLAGLSNREREVLRARYGFEGEPRSLRAIGERLGLSGEGVRRIEHRALGKLRAGQRDGPATGGRQR